MAISAVLFATTGPGAQLTGTGVAASASQEARESQFSAWAADDVEEDDGPEAGSETGSEHANGPSRIQGGAAHD